MLRSPDRVRGVEGEDLVDDEPVEDHPQRREVLLDGRRRARLGELLDVGRDHHRLDLVEGEASEFAPLCESADGREVGDTGVGILDVGGEELPEAALGALGRGDLITYQAQLPVARPRSHGARRLRGDLAAGLTVVMPASATFRPRPAIVSAPGLSLVRNQEGRRAPASPRGGRAGIPLESRLRENRMAGSESGGWKRDHGSRNEARCESAGITTRPYR